MLFAAIEIAVVRLDLFRYECLDAIAFLIETARVGIPAEHDKVVSVALEGML